MNDISNVTIAICTWNRADLLEQTLVGMRKLRIPENVEWELLVVNNNCTDHTQDIIARHEGSLPLRYVVEERQGQSHARNRAIREARGEFLVWTDDDVLVSEDWLEAYINAARDNPQASFFGGTILPWYENDPPKWLRRNIKHFGKALCVRHLGDEVRPLENSEKIAGANMAFRMNALKEYEYDPELSRIGAKLAGCEDHELIDRMREDGHTGMWVGTSVVQHFIPKERMTLQFARQWWREQAQLYLTRFPKRVPARGYVPQWLWRKYVVAIGREFIHRVNGGPVWAEAFFEAAWLRGLMDGCRSCVDVSAAEAGLAVK